MGMLVPKPYGFGLLTKVFVDIVKTTAKFSPSMTGSHIFITHLK